MRMAKRDYYDVLGVARDADEADVRKAYRRLAMKLHPDRNPDDKTAEEGFKEASEAYQVLSDAEKRSVYDRHGHAGLSNGNGAGGFAGGSFSDIFGDMFGDIFSGQGRRGGPQRGADLRYTLELDLEQAVRGETVEIKIPVLAGCEECDGLGSKPGTKPVTCHDCGGAGQIRVAQGFFSIQQTCPRCHGQGKVITEPCRACGGRGRAEKRKTLSVKIPAGVDTGDRIRLAGEGEGGSLNGPAGDLFVQIAVREHRIFQRDGKHLFCEAMWGLLVAVANFVPYFGPVAGIGLLSIVGLLSFETLWQGLLPPAWYLLLHLLEANLITPVVLGRRFTLNPVIIFVSLIFWTWLWGVPGALLSVPILVSVKVVCDRVPRLSSVSELLAN